MTPSSQSLSIPPPVRLFLGGTDAPSGGYAAPTSTVTFPMIVESPAQVLRLWAAGPRPECGRCLRCVASRVATQGDIWACLVPVNPAYEFGGGDAADYAPARDGG